MIKKTLYPAIFLLLFLSIYSPVYAHPGRTDSSGCHTCRTNCASWGLSYGEYHCHNGSSRISNESTVQSVPVQQQVIEIPTNTPVPTKIIIPTRKLTSTLVPYKETEMDKKKMFKVTRVIDGDTFEISIRGKYEKVRLLVIDTPETVDPRKTVQCFGKEATNKMKSFVLNKYVKFVDDRSQGNRDKYSRLLRYAFLEDGTFVNAEMVKQGYAFSYKQYPTKYLEEFNKYEKQAREKKLGLWNSCPVKK